MREVLATLKRGCGRVSDHEKISPRKADPYTDFLKAEFRFHGFVVMLSFVLMNALMVIAIVLLE
jgi:hypothetical protein